MSRDYADTATEVRRERGLRPQLQPGQTPPRVLEHEEAIQKSISHLHERIDLLTNRLTPVLSPKHGRPNGAASGAQPLADAPGVSPVADRLIADRNMIDHAAALIEALIDNLEI